MNALSLGFDPLLPFAAIAVLAGIALAVLSIGLLRRAPGLILRLIAAAGIIVALLNPALVMEEREPQGDIAVIVVDESASQNIGERKARTDKALAAVEARLKERGGVEVRIVRVRPGEGGSGRGPVDGTFLMGALDRAIAEIPRARLAGAIVISDGQVHDAPADASKFVFDRPLHALITGEKSEGDRRLVVVDAPSYGLVGQSVTLAIRVEDPAGVPAGNARVTIRRGAQAEIETLSIPTGARRSIDVVLDRAGTTAVEVTVEAGPRELTLDNNRAVVLINGVRDRLRVLLVSGEPHAGERSWRNLLKSDPAVDLVHFTILRPPEKQDGTPVRELSLIAFPIRELFEIKLNEFDLVIFDRYRNRGVLPVQYLANIADYVGRGGAFLEAVGPSFATPFGLYRTPLGAVLPASPTGEVIEQGYRAHLTETGRRHPVTADLEGAGAPGVAPTWGRWYRLVEGKARSGSVVMAGDGERPLLVLDRVGEGRVGQILTDQMWLWSRGFDGGGPQIELLRRMAHWLMKEPELEENDLTAEVRGGRLEIQRRSLEAKTDPVEVTFPSGRKAEVPMVEMGGGRSVGTISVEEAGIYRLKDGDKAALTVVGSVNPREFADVSATDLILGPLARATGGGVVWLAEAGEPDVRLVAEGRDTFGVSGIGGRPWLGLRANNDFVVRGVSELPLWPALATLFLALGALLLAWRREGR